MKNKRSTATEDESTHLKHPAELLQRAPPQDYIEEWTDVLMKKIVTPKKSGDNISILVFRLGIEWFALKTAVFQEIMHVRTIHSMPHYNSSILRGIVNLNGELQLCVALERLLEINTSVPISPKVIDDSRMMAIGKPGELWVIVVNEIDGIYNCDLSMMDNVPVTLAKSPVNYLKGLFLLKRRNVGLLDEELLFHSIKRSVK